jgi:hypothetical protein
MKYIAHRGLFQGPNKELENKPDQIKLALSKGYNAEVDIWWVDREWYLGHDKPQYKTSESFFEEKGLWLHCKNLDALFYMRKYYNHLVYFWHQNDDFTLTSNQLLWTYPGKDLTAKSVAVMPEYAGDEYWNYVKETQVYGVCTDYLEKFISETE